MSTLLKNFLFTLIALLPGLSKNARDDIIEKGIDTVSLLQTFGEFLQKIVEEIFLQGAKKGIIKSEKLQNAFGKVFQNIHDTFDNASEALLRHSERISESLEKDPNLRPWKIFGFLFQLGFLVIFAYADVVQMVNNLSPLYPEDIAKVPTIFQTLSLSLLMSSVGVAIAAGFILADLGGITHFGGWIDLKKPLKVAVQIILWFSIFTTLVIDAIVALSKIRTIPDVAQILTEKATYNLVLWPAIASNLVIIPMFLITLLFLQGFVGFKVIYIVLVNITSFLIEILHLIFIGIVWIPTYGVPYAFDALIRLLSWIFVAILGLIGWIVIGSGNGLKNLLLLFQSVVNLLYLPMDWTVGRLRKKVS